MLHTGSCHCGAVAFEVESDLAYAVECNCSMCLKKGALHVRVAPADFRLLRGAEELALYQFGTMTAKHWFCRRCGVCPYTNPRLDPSVVSVNARCLDGIDWANPPWTLKRFDGQNWEAAAAKYLRPK